MCIVVLLFVGGCFGCCYGCNMRFGLGIGILFVGGIGVLVLLVVLILVCCFWW